MAVNSSLNYFRKPVFLSALICAFIFYSGLFQLPDRTRLRSLLPTENISGIQGKLVSSPAKNGKGNYYSSVLLLEGLWDKNNNYSQAGGRITVMIPSELAEAYSPGKLFSLSKQGYLFESGGHFGFRGRISQEAFYVRECTASFWPDSLRGRLAKVRALCRLHFKRLMYSWGSGGGLLLALLCGAREYTEPATAEAFRRAGLSHILALSGMHLSMFSAIAVFFGNKAGIKKLTFVLRITALFAFVWFAGLSPSLMRAFICAMLALVAAIAGAKTPDMLSILCFSFLIQSAVCPQDIHNAAFILSYGALAGILLTGRFFNLFYSRFSPGPFAASLSAATGAQTFTAPISLKLFGSFSPIGIVSATIVSPFVTLFIYSGLALIILSIIFPILAKPSGIFINFQYTVIKFIVNIFSLVPNWSLN